MGRWDDGTLGRFTEVLSVNGFNPSVTFPSHDNIAESAFMCLHQQSMPIRQQLQAIINLIVESQYDENADVNEDGKVNGTDIQEVINIIVNAE